MNKIGEFLIATIAAVIDLLWKGYVLSLLWRWFFIPTLGLPEVKTVQAIGILVFVHLLINGTVKTKSRSETIWSVLLESLITTTVMLAFGYVVKLVMWA